MKKARMVPGVSAVAVVCFLLAAPVAGAVQSPWTVLGAGLELGRFPLADLGSPGAVVHVLRIDPRRWELTLRGIPSGETVGYTAREWRCTEKVAATTRRAELALTALTSAARSRRPSHRAERW